MKTEKVSSNFENQIVEYLRKAAAHGGYRWDGLEIAPGTTVASYKTIAAETGQSYYRVRKCIAALAGAGVLTIVRYKGFAVITVNADISPAPSPAPQDCHRRATSSPTKTVVARAVTDNHLPADLPFTAAEHPQEQPSLPHLNRAARRRIAREAARAAKASRHTARTNTLPERR